MHAFGLRSTDRAPALGGEAAGGGSRLFGVALAVLLLALPGTAFPLSLRTLLQLPLEQLLRLEITPADHRTVAPRAGGAHPRAQPPKERG